jgi:hypothetical protein
MALISSRRLLVQEIVLLSSLGVFLGCGEDANSPGDLTPPFEVTDLAVTIEEDTLIVLTWTAPSDEGSSGSVTAYDVRYSTSAITDGTWPEAQQAEGEPSPKDPGQSESFVIPGLRPVTSYYVALKAADDRGNESALSNVVLLDVDPPSAIADLAVTSTTSRSASLSWTAPSDNSEAGRADAYDIRCSLDPITEGTWGAAAQAASPPTPSAAGAPEEFVLPGLEPSTRYYCAIRSMDQAGNVSPISNQVEAVTAAAPVGWWDGFGADAPSKPVSALMVRDGKLIVGGEFTAVGALEAYGVASWDGGMWTAIGDGFVGTGTVVVEALSVYGEDLIAAGYFSHSGATEVNDIARWNGQSWLPLGEGIDSIVLALAPYDGYLFAGGAFFDAGGHEAVSIAFWDGSRWTSMGWSAKFSTGVSSLAEYGGELIAGGLFAAVGAGVVPADNVARWDGTEWRPLGYGLSGGIPYSNVSGLAVYNGDLIAAGNFTTSGLTAVNHIARWDGTAWSPLGGGIGDDPEIDFVGPMAVYNGALVVGGRFSVAGGVPVSNIARWDGASWSSLGEGLSGGDEYANVRALAVYDGSLYVGGSFATAGGVSSSYIARWDD